MSTMEHAETFDRYKEGMKKSISRCRELGAAQKNMNWFTIANHLEGILSKGESFYRGKAVSRQDALNMIESRVSKMDKDQ